MPVKSYPKTDRSTHANRASDNRHVPISAQAITPHQVLIDPMAFRAWNKLRLASKPALEIAP